MTSDDIINLWGEDTDINVVKTWLVGGTGGQTYSILDRFLPKIKIDASKYDFDLCDIEYPMDEIIGFKHDYKIDDPDLEKKAKEVVDGLNAFVEKVNTNPGDYFSLTNEELAIEGKYSCHMCAHQDACRVNKPDYDIGGLCGAFKICKDK